VLELAPGWVLVSNPASHAHPHRRNQAQSAETIFVGKSKFGQIFDLEPPRPAAAPAASGGPRGQRQPPRQRKRRAPRPAAAPAAAEKKGPAPSGRPRGSGKKRPPRPAAASTASRKLPCRLRGTSRGPHSSQGKKRGQTEKKTDPGFELPMPDPKAAVYTSRLYRPHKPQVGMALGTSRHLSLLRTPLLLPLPPLGSSCPGWKPVRCGGITRVARAAC